MKSTFAAAAAACLLTGVSIPSQAAAEAQITNAEEGWAAFTKCAADTDARSRHACFDNLSRAAGLLPSVETTHRKTFGLQSSAAPKTDSARKPEQQQLEVTLASVEKGGDGKLTLTTTDGAVWKQADSDTIRQLPEQGQKMTIEKASLGSFICKPTKWLAFRCSRLR